MPPKSFLKKPASLAKGLDRFPRERLHRLSQLEKWHFWFVGRRAWLDSFLQKHFKDKKKRILDLGCGTGFTLKHLAQMGYRAVGTDFRFEGLHRVRRTATSPVVQADATRLPFADLSFDLVVALDVLEHVEDHAALAEIKRILKPQGRLALTVPAFRWLWSVRDDEAGHLRRYTRGEMQTLLRSHGFEKIEIHFYQFFLFPWVVLSRFLGRNRPASRDREETPFPLLNRALACVNQAEVLLAPWFRWPYGSSLLVHCRKKNDAF